MYTRFKHYNTYYGAVMACTLLSNDGSPEFRRDAASIIDFYCAARGLEPSVAEQWKHDILDVLSQVELIDERDAEYRKRFVDRTYADRDFLYDIKGDVLFEICTKYRENTIFVNRDWFNYTHVRRYNPDVRFAQLKAASSSGWRVATRQVGIMLALGIGCRRDADAAIYKFLQGVYWCDVPSCIMAAYLMRLEGDEEGARVYGDLAVLLRTYLKDGITVVPAEVASNYDPKAVVKYAQISSIFRDVCCAYNLVDIDYSFVEVMLDDTVTDNQKMDFINHYRQKTWLNVSNPVLYHSNSIGFNGGNHD